MPSPITLQGIGSLTAPGVYGQLNLGASQNSVASAVYPVVFLGNIGSAGSAYATAGNVVYGPDTQTPMQSENDAINLFTAGSPLHLAIAAFMAVNKTTPVYAIPVPEATAGTAASMTFTVTANGISGNPVQSSGLVQIKVDGKVPVQVQVGATDTASTIASNIAKNINGNVKLPVTASALAATVTVTAKVKGQRSNWIRVYPKVLSGSGVTLSVNVPTFMTSGAGSDAAGYVTALNTLATSGASGGFYYYYIPEAGWDSVDGYNSVTGYANGPVSLIQAQLDTLMQPTSGLRQRALFASIDTLSSSITTTFSNNDARCEAIWCKNADITPFEFASKWAAAVTVFETYPLSVGGVNFDSFGGDAVSASYWSLPSPDDGSAPSTTDIQTAILSGLSPVRVTRGGRTNVVKRVTAHCQQTVGASTVSDYRIVDSGKVTISDYFLNDLIQLISIRYPRCVIVTDPTQGQPANPPSTVCAGQIRDVVIEVVNNYASANLVDASKIIPGVIVQRETNPTTTISVEVPLYTNDCLHIVALLVNQVS